jgi:hypothetical protein
MGMGAKRCHDFKIIGEKTLDGLYKSGKIPWHTTNKIREKKIRI